MIYLFRIVLIAVALPGCAPYAQGPVFTVEDAHETFQPLVELMEITPGMAVADVGAGSGALTVIMATQLDSCTVYIQDIDREILEQDNVNKMVSYYSKKLGYELGQRNDFQLVYGTVTESNLPDHAIDIIYSNATLHVLDHPEAMLQDLRQKLKPTGKIFIRDSFRGDHEEGAFCEDKKCGKSLYSIDEFKALMTDNGYHLIRETPDLSGYPVFGFEPAK